MKSKLPFLKTICVVSILFGIILPYLLGIRDITLIAVSFTIIWFLYAVAFFVLTFLIEERRLRRDPEKSGSK